MENQENIKENEEISIIDLLAVLIKYRKLIIIGTIIPAVIAALWLFVAKPILKPVEMPETETKAVYTIRLTHMPQKLYDELWRNYVIGWDFNGRIINDFSNPVLMGALYEKNQFADLCEEGKGEEYIKNLIQSKVITCANSLDMTYSITINMPTFSLEKFQKFVEEYVEYENNLVKEIYIGDNINLIELRCKRLIKDVETLNPKTVNFSDIQNAIDTLEAIEKWRKENKPFFEIEGKPVITTITPPAPPKEPKVKELIIVAVASLFIFIFIAFLLNAIQNIKDDPVSSQKIKDAWKEGK